MKKLLLIFKITWFQAFIIVLFSSLKYILVTYQLDDKIRKPFIWTSLGAGVIFLVALSITGIIENRGETYENYRTRMQAAGSGKFLISFVTWGVTIPVALAYAIFLYLVAPTSWDLLAALYAGIVIKNIIQFFSKEQDKINQELN
jgi:hypothetical protein